MLRWKVGAEGSLPAIPPPLLPAVAGAVLLLLVPMAMLPVCCWLYRVPCPLPAAPPLPPLLLAAPLEGPTYCMGTSSGRTSVIERATGMALLLAAPAPVPAWLLLPLLLLAELSMAFWLLLLWVTPPPPLLLLLCWPCRAATFSASSVGANGRMTGFFRSVCPRLATAAGGGSGYLRTFCCVRDCPAGLADTMGKD